MFVVPSLSKGGAERVVSILASELVKKGKEVNILTYYKTDQDYPVDKRVNIHCLSGGYEADYRKLSKIKRISLTRKFIKQEKPDIVLPFLGIVCVRTWFSCLFTGITVAQTLRINFEQEGGSVFKKKLRKYLIEHSKLSLVQNEEQKKSFSKSAHKNIYVLPNPISTQYIELEHNKSTDKKRIVAAGRLEDQKNYPMLFSAIKELLKTNNNFTVEIYGDGSLKEQLSKQIVDMELQNTVKLMGRANNLVPVYKEADIFVMTSDYEGMPNALMEAMASEVACVSTDCPTGPSDLICSGENGFLVPVGEYKECAKSIAMLLDNDELLCSMGKKARQAITDNYMPEKITEKLISICETVKIKKKNKI